MLAEALVTFALIVAFALLVSIERTVGIEVVQVSLELGDPP